MGVWSFGRHKYSFEGLSPSSSRSDFPLYIKLEPKTAQAEPKMARRFLMFFNNIADSLRVC